MAIQILFIGTQIVFDGNIVITDDAAGCICCGGDIPVECDPCFDTPDNTAPPTLTVTLTGATGWSFYGTYVLDWYQELATWCVYKYIFDPYATCTPTGGSEIEVDYITASIALGKVQFSLHRRDTGNENYTVQTFTSQPCNTAETYSFVWSFGDQLSHNCNYPLADVII